MIKIPEFYWSYLQFPEDHLKKKSTFSYSYHIHE